uniref:Frizzled B n=1 Tax=Oscarella carmela TaxID=386100 RepID=A0A0B5CM78_OSCCA|nr:frizzled B [Oscarella carmela]|eukprot:m.310448 g.310448  ORF g.310448 m.310448 type:complete len:586 (+) comp51684_c0_seq1:60-1817(+)
MLLPALLFAALAALFNSPVRVEAVDAVPDWVRRANCYEMNVDTCAGIGYNTTLLPNRFGHRTLPEAALEISTYVPLIQFKCSPELRFMACATFLPICTTDPVTNAKRTLPPCRQMCQRVQTGCEPVVKRWLRGVAWPAALSCDELPDEMDSLEDGTPPCFDNATQYAIDIPGGPDSGFNTTYPPLLPAEEGTEVTVNNSQLLAKRDSCYRYMSGRKTEGFLCINCNYDEQAKPGESAGYYFKQEDIAFANYWVGIWAVLCFLSTLFTCLTFLIDRDRFHYPERPIIYLAVCYCVFSLGFIARLFAGDERIACDQTHGILIKADANHAGCTAIFMVLYFSMMAASVWWVVLTVTWFLAAGMKWSNEAIESLALYYHLVAWIVPLIMTIVALILQKIDADELTRVCFVGAQDVNAMAGFVVAPLALFLVVGTIFIIAGFAALFRIREVIKSDRSRSGKLEKLMIRIGVFSVLYTVPATIVIGCYFYEYFARNLWSVHTAPQWNQLGDSSNKTFTFNGDVPSTCPQDDSCTQALPAVFYIKFLMSLIVGVTSGVWIWSSKTLATWNSFISKSCSRLNRGKDRRNETTV